MRAPHSSQPSARDVAALEVSNAALRSQVDELRERIESGGKAALAEASALPPRLEAQAEALASSRRMLDERDAELAASHRECEELRGDADCLRARCDDLEEQLVRAAGDAEASRAEVHKLVHAHKVAQAVAAATEAVLCDGQEADAGAEVRVPVEIHVRSDAKGHPDEVAAAASEDEEESDSFLSTPPKRSRGRKATHSVRLRSVSLRSPAKHDSTRPDELASTQTEGAEIAGDMRAPARIEHENGPIRSSAAPDTIDNWGRRRPGGWPQQPHAKMHVDAPASEAAKDRGIALQTREDNVTAGGRGALVVLDSASGSDSEEWSDVDHFLGGGGMSADLKHANNARQQAAIDRQLRGCREALREFHGQGSIAGVRSPLAKRSARLSERRQKLEELEQLQRAHDEAELHELARTDQQRRARQRRDYLANARNLL